MNPVLLFILICYLHPSAAQVDIKHRWKKFDKKSDMQIWYDLSVADTITGNRFDVWILQVHNPPLHSKGIKENIFRSETLYSVNLNSFRYGIMKLQYYDVKNMLLYKFDSDDSLLPTNELKYPYPILEDSPINLFIETYFENNTMVSDE
ncbi:MAG: hypothetical protein PVF17_11085 [Ignavibacteria bacterium]|jgi:hypothetical protein